MKSRREESATRRLKSVPNAAACRRRKSCQAGAVNLITTWGVDNVPIKRR